MSEPQQVKILIVGGGPAGLSAALHLVKRAPQLVDDILILEAKEYPRPKLCGGGITVHGDEQMERLGIEVDVPAFTVHELAFQLGQQAFNIPFQQAMRVIQREEFDEAIAQKAIETGIRICTGERVLDVHIDDEGVDVETDQAHYRAEMIIAADGTNSIVRRKLGFPSSQSTARLLRVLVPVDPETNPVWQAKKSIFDFSCIQRGVRGYMWEFPCVVDGVPHCNYGIYDSNIGVRPRQPHGNFKQTFADWLAERGVSMDSVELKGHPVRWFSRKAEFSKPRVLLTGDAAGVDPLFAEGISYAMEYGTIVADTICHAIEHGDYSFVDYRERLLVSRMGKLLLRRVAIANAIYRYHLPPFWWLVWRFAGYAWPGMQQSIGAWMALLPAR